MTNRKIILTGNFGVGKTSLFNKFIYNTFNDKYLTTIGVKVNKKVVEVEGETVSLVVWDIAGEINQNKVPTSYFLGASCVIYVFDLTRAATYLNIKSDLDYLQQFLPESMIKVVGNKVDLVQEDVIQSRLCEVPVDVDTLTSAKFGTNVEQLFLSLATELINN